MKGTFFTSASIDVARANMLRFRHDAHLYIFWRNVYVTLAERENNEKKCY